MEPPYLPNAPRVQRYSFLEPCLLLREAGRGGMGTVYEAYDVLRSRRVAVKVSRYPVASHRFYLEAVLGIADLGPHVVQVLDIRRLWETDYILMEWVEGADLQSVTAQGVLSAAQIVEVASQVCEGLGRIHAQGIIHRDIKPANLMVTHEGVVKLADFGIAQSSEALHMSTVGPIGTRVFMSPEQRDGRKADERSDIYSLGVTLYMLATGMMHRERSQELNRMLVDGLSPLSELLPGFHLGLAGVITRCTAHERDDRYSGVEEVACALAELGLDRVLVLPELKRSAATVPSKEVIRQARELRNRTDDDQFGDRDGFTGGDALTVVVADDAGRNRWGPPIAGTLVFMGLVALGAMAFNQEESNAAKELSRSPEAPAVQETVLASGGEETVESEPGQPKETSGEPAPVIPSLPELPGFLVHVDEHGLAAYVPKLTIQMAPALQRKLRFVALDLEGHTGFLVQEMEVANALAFALGAIEDPGESACLPWSGITQEEALDLVDRLNAVLPSPTTFQFLLPSVEQRGAVENSPSFCTLMKPSWEEAPQETKVGYAPTLQPADPEVPLERVYSASLWHPSASTGLYGLVGNVGEWCRTEDPKVADLRGGAEQDRLSGSIRPSSSKLFTTAYRSKGAGMRLFLKIVR